MDGGRGGEYYNDYNMAVPYYRRVVKIGDSLGITLPWEVVAALKIQRGRRVAVSVVEEGEIRIFLMDGYEPLARPVKLPEIN